MLLYEFDENQVFTGHFVNHSPKTLIPKNYTAIRPPMDGGIYQFNKGYWVPLEDYPAPKPPERKTLLTQFEFRSRFTLQEKVAIETARETDPVLRVILGDMEAAREIDLENPQLIEGVQYVESQGLIAEGRADEILA